MPLRPIEEVVEDYVDSLSYQENNSVEQAKVFIAATRELLVRRPETTLVAGNTVRFDSMALRHQLKDAQSWYESNRTDANAGSVRYYDSSNIRGN